MLWGYAECLPECDRNNQVQHPGTPPATHTRCLEGYYRTSNPLLGTMLSASMMPLALPVARAIANTSAVTVAGTVHDARFVVGSCRR